MPSVTSISELFHILKDIFFILKLYIIKLKSLTIIMDIQRHIFL